MAGLLEAQPVAAAAEPPQVEVLAGPATLPVTGIYTLAFRLRGAPLQKYSEFPELEGFKKNGKTSTTTTRTVQGKSFSELTITQRYMPYGEGEVVIKPFQMTVNGVTVRFGGTTVRVGPAQPPPTQPKPIAPTTAPATTVPAGTAPLQAVGSLDQLFGKPKPALYQETPDHAFLAVEADRPRVFVGEGVTVGLYFYLLPADQALLAFHDFDDQVPQMLRQLHQPTAWETPATPVGTTPDTIRWAGQLYLRFRLSENTYYPLTAEPLRFPALALTMTKFKTLKRPEPGQDNRLATYKTYYAPGLTVLVRPLPPLRDAVPVGDYVLREGISRTTFQTGQVFNYTFGVEGRGNLGALLPPVPLAYPGLDVYGPDVREEARPGGGKKLFRYRLVARRPGIVPLDSLLQLIVFNPHTAHYDTIRPALHPEVRGAVRPAETRLPTLAEDPFYGPAIAQADAFLQPLNVYADVRRYANWLLAGLLVLAGVGWWQAGRRAE
jgi:hypothetical protein